MTPSHSAGPNKVLVALLELICTRFDPGAWVHACHHDDDNIVAFGTMLHFMACLKINKAVIPILGAFFKKRKHVPLVLHGRFTTESGLPCVFRMVDYMADLMINSDVQSTVLMLKTHRVAQLRDGHVANARAALAPYGGHGGDAAAFKNDSSGDDNRFADEDWRQLWSVNKSKSVYCCFFIHRESERTVIGKPPVFSRCGSLLPSASADVRAILMTSSHSDRPPKRMQLPGSGAGASVTFFIDGSVGSERVESGSDAQLAVKGVEIVSAARARAYGTAQMEYALAHVASRAMLWTVFPCVKSRKPFLPTICSRALVGCFGSPFEGAMPIQR